MKKLAFQNSLLAETKILSQFEIEMNIVQINSDLMFKKTDSKG